MTHRVLLQALEDEQQTSLEALLRPKANGFVFAEALQSLPQKLLPRLCRGLSSQVAAAVARLHQRADGQDTATPAGITPQAPTPPDIESAAASQVLLLKVLAAWIGTTLRQCSPNLVPDALIAAACRLHDDCLLAVPQFPDLQEAVVKLCHSWWQAGAAGRQLLIAQTLPLVLVKALTTGKVAAVKRCHALRAALPLLDFEDEASIRDLKAILLRALFSPSFLRPAEGRRFLSSLFLIQPQMTRELGAIVRNQIPTGRQSMLSGFGDVLHRAWRDADGTNRLEIEDIVQGLMQAAVLAKTPTLNNAIRTVLNGFHAQKVHAAVDSMLLRLYEPILFRGIAANNSNVRRNALLLLFDAFPLEDPEASADRVSALMTQQFEAIRASLADVCPAVRAAAATGICGILNVFWEVLPAHVIAGFLKHVTGKLAFDCTSPAVRVSTVRGVALLTENPIARPLLKPLLPGLGRLLWDPSVAVKAAFVDLLTCIQRVQSLSVTALVSPEELLDVLGLEKPAVRTKIQQLLLPTYFPDPEEGPAILAYLLRSAPAAGRAFCSCLCGAQGSGPMAPLEDLLSLAQKLKDHLLASPPAEKEDSRGRTEEQQQSSPPARKGKRKKRAGSENQVSEDGETREAWLSILGGLAELCAGLTRILPDDLPEEDCHQEVLSGDDLTRLHDMAPSSEGRADVLSIAASLAIYSPSAAQEMQLRCREALSRVGDPIDAIELLAILRCLAAGEDVFTVDLPLEAISKSCQPGISICNEEASFSSSESIDRAVLTLDLLLADSSLREALLPEAGSILTAALEAASNDATQSLLGCLAAAGRGLQPRTAPAAGGLITAHIRLSMHNILSQNETEAARGTGEGASPASGIDSCLESSLATAEAALKGLEAIGADRLWEMQGSAIKEQPLDNTKRAKLLSSSKTSHTTAVRHAWDLVTHTLTAAADAHRLLPALSAQLQEKMCDLVSKLLAWLRSLSTGLSEGDLFGPANALSEALLVAFRLLCLRAINLNQPQTPINCSSGNPVTQAGSSETSSDNQLSHLAESALELSCASRSAGLPASRIFLGPLLKAICSSSLDSLSCMRPLAAAMAAEVLDAAELQQGSPDAAGHTSEPDENLSPNPRPAAGQKDVSKSGKKQAALDSSQAQTILEHPFLRAVLKAAAADEVKQQITEIAAESAQAFWNADDEQRCLGAAQICIEMQGLGASLLSKKVLQPKSSSESHVSELLHEKLRAAGLEIVT